jgi:hypothetical protein
MKNGALVCSMLVLAGCASSSVSDRAPAYRDGLGPDLRVFSDADCLPPAGPVVRGGLGLGGTLLKGVASLAMQSFGQWLVELGSPEIETAYGTHAGLFWGEDEKTPELNRDLRCIYIVRDGFQSKGFDSKAPEAIRKTWARLGVTGTPSFYAMVRLDPAEDNSQNFKATLLDFTVQRYARMGAEDGRDYVVSLEFAIPSGGRTYKVSNNGEITLDPAGPFARGIFPLRGAQQGVYMGAAELKGVESGWMVNPPRTDGSGRRPVNLYVDVVELKRGNPFIADLGRFLKSSAVADAAGNEALKLTQGGERERQDVAAGIAQEKVERGLAHTLEDKLLDLNAAMASTTTSKSALLNATQAVEDALADIDGQKRKAPWLSTPSPDATVTEAKTVVARARVRLTTP